MSGEIQLHRVDYAQVGTTSKRCLRLLPATTQSPTNRIVVGSQNGELLCFQWKKNNKQVIFNTLPGPKIEYVVLAGALGTPLDKIFYTAGNAVKGYSKKGKQFFSFESNLTEPIQCMFIYGVDMFLCGSSYLYHYHDCVETNYYLCSDRINDIVCLPVTEGSWVGRGLTPVLGCDDRTIKVLNGSDLAYQVQLGGVPVVLVLWRDTGGADGTLVAYGCRDGRIGLAQLPSKTGLVKWEVPSNTSGAAVTSMCFYNLSKQGVTDLIVGKDDGNIEVYAVDEQDKIDLVFTKHVDDSITAVAAGKVQSTAYDEIVVCTYTGWIYGLTTEPQQRQVGSTPQSAVVNPEVDAKVQQMKAELETLQNQVAVERERYHEQTSQETGNGLSSVPVFAVNDRFTLLNEDAAYVLTIELVVPIDYILLQCDVSVDLLDMDTNSAVVSMTNCEPNAEPFQSGNALLATYRCQANTTKLDIKIRSIEGQHGTLQAYISPKTNPKICQVRQYPIKPLSLHQRAHSYDSSRPQNVLTLTGTFSLAEAHAWTTFCLAELPEKPPTTETATFYFQSTFTNTQLECSYSKGKASYRSDNLSTIAILRDVLSKEATKRNVKLHINTDVNDDSLAHTLQLLHPRLEYLLNLAKKVHLSEALKELVAQEQDTSFLSEEFLEIIKKSDELAVEHKQQHAHLERIYGVITDLFIDKYKFKGMSVKHRVPQLLHTLDNYTLDSLLAFFQQPN